MTGRLLPLVTRDPATGGELIVTRLEAPVSGVVIEGRFSLGWVGRLTPEQLEFAGMLIRHRGNLQRLAIEFGVAYNTVRSRMDDIVEALAGSEPTPAPEPSTSGAAADILDRLRAGQIDVDEAVAALERPTRN